MVNDTTHLEMGLRPALIYQPNPCRSRKLKTKQPKIPSATETKPKGKVEKLLYQTLGQDLLSSIPLTTSFPCKPSSDPSNILSRSITSSYLSPSRQTSMSNSEDSFFTLHDELSLSRSSVTVNVIRRSEDSRFSNSSNTSLEEHRPATKRKFQGAIYNLDDLEAMSQAESLIRMYGRVAHMGVRDPSYFFWINHSQTAVVHFKLLHKVAIVGGDPLCHPDRMQFTIQEFEEYCRHVGWKTAVIAASSMLAGIAKGQGWTTMRFGTETVLNPQTNEALLGKSGKRIVVQCKQLLDPSRGGISVHTYSPNLGRDERLEAELRHIYDEWRNVRNTTRESQAFITVFDLFSMNSLMTFLYTKDKTGRVNGFAALRRLGAVEGYHIDPFIQTPDAPRGVSDLLIYASLAFLNALGSSYLSLGFEPLPVVGEITGLPTTLHSTTRRMYKHVFGKIPVGGKEAFHARWKPDTTQESALHLIFVGRIPSPRFMIAMTHYANISLRSIIKQDWQELKKRSRSVTVDDARKRGLSITLSREDDGASASNKSNK